MCASLLNLFQSSFRRCVLPSVVRVDSVCSVCTLLSTFKWILVQYNQCLLDIKINSLTSHANIDPLVQVPILILTLYNTPLKLRGTSGYHIMPRAEEYYDILPTNPCSISLIGTPYVTYIKRDHLGFFINVAGMDSSFYVGKVSREKNDHRPSYDRYWVHSFNFCKIAIKDL